MKNIYKKLGTAAALALMCGILIPLFSMPAFAASTPLAASGVVLSSEAMIERQETGPDGKERTILKHPKDVIVVPGDRVVFTLRYVNKGAEPAAGFRATNPLPPAVQFVSAAEEWAEVSVDGGAVWGKLADLTIAANASGGLPGMVRAATPEDVTHVRWIFAMPIASGAQGSVSYRGMVK